MGVREMIYFGAFLCIFFRLILFYEPPIKKSSVKSVCLPNAAFQLSAHSPRANNKSLSGHACGSTKTHIGISLFFANFAIDAQNVLEACILLIDQIFYFSVFISLSDKINTRSSFQLPLSSLNICQKLVDNV